MNMKTTKFVGFLKPKRNASLVPNPIRKKKKIRTITQNMQNNNSTRFYYKNEKKHNKVVIRKCTQN
jgi:hypothetical protein